MKEEKRKLEERLEQLQNEIRTAQEHIHDDIAG
jgi:uncharacterized protein YlxW (UPF0749 family)